MLSSSGATRTRLPRRNEPFDSAGFLFEVGRPHGPTPTLRGVSLMCGTHMSIVAKLASIIGAMLFLAIVFAVGGAVIQYMTWNPPMKKPTDVDGDELNESTNFRDKEKGERLGVAKGDAR